MLRATLIGLAGVALLASCAPTFTAATVGRVVNASTGEEGTVTFQPGALRTRAGDPFGGNNTTVVIGGQTYAGRAALLDAVVAVPANTKLNFGIAFAAGSSGGNTSTGYGLFLGTQPAQPGTLRTGNLIAKTAGTGPRTLTCTLQVDEREHGVGDCTGSDGVRYVLQF